MSKLLTLYIGTSRRYSMVHFNYTTFVKPRIIAPMVKNCPAGFFDSAFINSSFKVTTKKDFRPYTYMGM